MTTHRPIPAARWYSAAAACWVSPGCSVRCQRSKGWPGWTRVTRRWPSGRRPVRWRAALLGCRLPVDAICRHHQGVPAPADPLIDYDYHGTGGSLPPRPGWRPGVTPAGLGRPAPPASDLAHRGAVRSAAAGPRHARSGARVDRRGRRRSGPRLIVAETTASVDRRGRLPQRAAGGVRARRARPERRCVRGSCAGPLADAVQASCSIPAWYPPTVIDGVPYVDGGTMSNASVDVLARNRGGRGVRVRADGLCRDRPCAAPPCGRMERAVRRAITRGIMADVARLRADGVRVCLLTPEPEDLATMGVNLMNPARRTEVLETAQVTVAAAAARSSTARAGWTHSRPAVQPRRTPRVRVYVPATTTRLRALSTAVSWVAAADRVRGDAGAAGVVPRRRRRGLGVRGHARRPRAASLRLLDTDPAAARRRVVVSRTDVRGRGRRRSGTTSIAAWCPLDEAVALGHVASVHVDDPEAEAAVSAAADAIIAADLGDEEAQDRVDDAEGFELSWYASQEIGGAYSTDL